MALLDGGRWRCHWPSQSTFGPRYKRDHLRMAEIEVKAANLIQRREEEAAVITREVIDQVLGCKQMGRQLELLDSQIVTQRHQQAVMEVGYRMRQGTTGIMLTV